MSNLEMDIYTRATGVQVTIAWVDEDEYQLGKKFLTELGAGCGQSSDRRSDKSAFYYLETEDQLKSLYAFMRGLRDNKET